MINDNDSEEFKVKLNSFNHSIYSNIYQEISPWLDSVAFRPNSLRHEYFGSRGDCSIAEDFILNSKYTAENREFQHSVVSYFGDDEMMNVHQQSDSWGNTRKFDYSAYEKNSLGNGIKLTMPLGNAISSRRSIREFTGDTIKLDYLSSVLRAASGVSGFSSNQLTDGTEVKLAVRTCASGGGLYPIDIIFAAINVHGLKKDIYKYIPRTDIDDHLIALNSSDKLPSLIDAFVIPENTMDLNQAGIIAFLVASPWKSMRKYGSRGLRFTFLEAGAIAQNIHLACTGLGLGSCDYGGYVDQAIETCLGFDGLNTCVIHAMIIGVK